MVSNSPKFSDKKFISLEKLNSIDISDLSLYSNIELTTIYDSFIDFDKDSNMYVLNKDDNTITVFNNNGKIVKTIGRTGLGPSEFYRSNTLIINDEKIYVFEFMNDYKVVNLKGEYINIQRIPITNRLYTDIIGNNFYVFEGRPDRTFTDLDLVLSVKNNDFLKSRDVFIYKYLPGFRGPNYEFVWANWILLTRNGEFYFPENNLNEYSIVKYNKEGKPLFKFGRKYKIKNYSVEAKNRFNRLYNKEKE